MYVAVDIGGTKTLVASLDDNGVITQKIRFETPKKYDFFLHELRFAVHKLDEQDFHAGGVGAPGTINRSHGIGLFFGNLPWKNVHLQHDIERILKCPIVLENDAKMAALSESKLINTSYNKVLYVTISTGIGYGLVVDGTIDTATSDAGGKSMLVEHKGKLVSWESFASGRAIVARYGKKAQDINDKKTWLAIVRDLRPGLLELIAVLEPDIIVFGGSVGVYFDRYGKLLREDLLKYETPMMPVPKLQGAKRPEDAVLYGCYDLAKETYSAITG